MKSILIAALCAVALTAQAEEAKRDTIHKYTIDKQAVEHFDGSQLEGKRISKYIIAYKEGKGVVEKHHVIYTGDEVKTFLADNRQESSVKDSDLKRWKQRFDYRQDKFRNMESSLFKGIIIIDGNEVTPEEFAKINAQTIEHVEVLKAGSEAAKSYGKKGKNGVIQVTTKAVGKKK